MKHLGVRELNKNIKELERGAIFYVNTMGMTEKAFVKFQELLKSGVIVPDIDELDKWLSPDADNETRQKFFTGEYVLPQMMYIKRI